MRVLVSGANGYLGSVLLHALSRLPSIRSVTALVRRAERFTHVRDQRFPSGTTWLDWSELAAGDLDLTGIDIVCHLAAGRGVAAPGEIADTLRLSASLFRQAAQQGIKGIINASSQAVYGLSPPLWAEGDQPAPVSVYGTAKLAQEVLVENLALAAMPTRSISLRLAKLVGPSPMFRVAPDEYPHAIAREAIAGKDVALPAGGEQKLDLLDVRDAAEVIVALLGLPVERWPTLVNVGSGRQVTLLEVAHTVFEQMRAQSIQPDRQPRILVKRSGQPPRHYGMSVDLIKHLLGWSARYSLSDTVQEVISSHLRPT